MQRRTGLDSSHQSSDRNDVRDNSRDVRGILLVFSPELIVQKLLFRSDPDRETRTIRGDPEGERRPGRGDNPRGDQESEHGSVDRVTDDAECAGREQPVPLDQSCRDGPVSTECVYRRCGQPDRSLLRSC